MLYVAKHWEYLAVFYQDAARLYLSEGVEARRRDERERPDLLGQEAFAVSANGGERAAMGGLSSCPANDALVSDARSEASQGAALSIAAAPPRPEGFEVTTWAGGKVFLPAEEVGVAKASQMKAARGAFIPGNYLYPVPDVTGTPRVWANAAGLTVTRIMTGPYGEELGFYEEPCYSDIGFAGNISDQFTGLSYTPNRYLDNLQGRFLSVDPSGTKNVHDPRTFNQYMYVLGNPLILLDPEGLSAWDAKNEWNEDYIEQYRQYVSETAARSPDRYTCDDFALSLLVDFAFWNDLPVRITNGTGTYDSSSDQFDSWHSFRLAVLKTTGARDLQRNENTTAIAMEQAGAGDLVLRRLNGRTADHVQVVVSNDGGVIDIAQGNFRVPGWRKTGTGDPSDPFPIYLGTKIQTGVYYLTAGHYYSKRGLTQIGDMHPQARSWDFLGWNK